MKIRSLSVLILPFQVKAIFSKYGNLFIKVNVNETQLPCFAIIIKTCGIKVWQKNCVQLHWASLSSFQFLSGFKMLKFNNFQAAMMALLPLTAILTYQSVSYVNFAAHTPVKLSQMAFHQFYLANTTLCGNHDFFFITSIHANSSYPAYKVNLSVCNVSHGYHDISHDLPRPNISYNSRMIETSPDISTFHHKLQNLTTIQTNTIEFLNAFIYSVLVLFILCHVSILLVDIVFVSLNFCFNSPRTKPNVLTKLLSGEQNPFSLNVFVHDTGMILVDDFCSQSVFNSILISIISITYIIALCYCFPEKSKHVFHFVSKHLVVLAHTVYEKFLVTDQMNFGLFVNLMGTAKFFLSVYFFKSVLFIRLLPNYLMKITGNETDFADTFRWSKRLTDCVTDEYFYML